MPISDPASSAALPEPASTEDLRSLTRIALYAALVGAGAFIHVPLGPLHISLQTMMVMLAGFVLGPRLAALSLAVYVATGLLGLPVFGQGRAGPAALFGPTAGFFLGFVPGAAIAGIARERSLPVKLLFGGLGTVIILLVGTVVLRYRFIPGWNRAFLVGFTPFIVGDLVKMTLAAFVSRAFFIRRRNAQSGDAR